KVRSRPPTVPTWRVASPPGRAAAGGGKKPQPGADAPKRGGGFGQDAGPFLRAAAIIPQQACGPFSPPGAKIVRERPVRWRRRPPVPGRPPRRSLDDKSGFEVHGPGHVVEVG